jgi:hypothetical protein
MFDSESFWIVPTQSLINPSQDAVMTLDYAEGGAYLSH